MFKKKETISVRVHNNGFDRVADAVKVNGETNSIVVSCSITLIV